MDQERIEQFKKMVEADPDNELGHFSLGKAYVDDEQWADAIPSLQKVIDINPQSSKAYQLLGLAQKQNGEAAEAVSTLRIGYEIASGRGDLMPARQIAELLAELGEKVAEPPPEDAAPAPAQPGEGEVACRRCGRTAPALPDRPFKGELGEQVLASICQACWTEWIHMGTKVINEFRLDFAQPAHAQLYDQHMREFLHLD